MTGPISRPPEHSTTIRAQDVSTDLDALARQLKGASDKKTIYMSKSARGRFEVNRYNFFGLKKHTNADRAASGEKIQAAVTRTLGGDRDQARELLTRFARNGHSNAKQGITLGNLKKLNAEVKEILAAKRNKIAAMDDATYAKTFFVADGTTRRCDFGGVKDHISDTYADLYTKLPRRRTRRKHPRPCSIQKTSVRH